MGNAPALYPQLLDGVTLRAGPGPSPRPNPALPALPAPARSHRIPEASRRPWPSSPLPPTPPLALLPATARAAPALAQDNARRRQLLRRLWNGPCVPLPSGTPLLAAARLPEREAVPQEASRPTALLAAQGKAFADTAGSGSPGSPGSSGSSEIQGTGDLHALQAGEGSPSFGPPPVS